MSDTDIFGRLPRGTPLGKIGSERIQSWNHAARLARDSELHGGGQGLDGDLGPGQIKVKNSTGAILAEFAVTTVGAPIVAPSLNLDTFKRNRCFAVSAPGSPTDRAIVAILQQSLPDGQIGVATILGETAVQIQVDSDKTTWQWADVSSGDKTKLVMKQNNGPARILWKESGSGLKWASVLLQVQFARGSC